MMKRIRGSAWFGVAVIVLGACGGGDDSPAANEADEAAGEVSDAANEASEAADGAAADAAETAQDVADEFADQPEGDPGATVAIGDETYHFAWVEPGADDDFYNLCTAVSGSLQGVLQQVDESGNYLGDGQISFLLLEPGGAYASTGDPAELQIDLADGTYVSSYDGGEINAPADGNTASGTFSIPGRDADFNDFVADGTIEATC